MSRTAWPLLVRRSELWGSTPSGGGFARVAVPPFPVPGLLAHELGVYCADTTEKVVALTYDDGPHPDHTPRILDELARRGATATFFVMAPRVTAHADLARRIVAEGHELALHGADHLSLLTLGDREALGRIRAARRQVEDVTGTRLRLYRPPYGRHTALQAYGIRAMGLDLVIWSGDAVDYLHDDEATIVRRARDAVFPGGILLLHDDRADPETLGPGEELPRFDKALVLSGLLDELFGDGYRTTTVGSLLDEYRPVRSRSRERRPRS